MTTPLPKGIVQTTAAAATAMNVKKPNLLLELLKKAMPRKNSDIGKSTKKATEAKKWMGSMFSGKIPIAVKAHASCPAEAITIEE